MSFILASASKLTFVVKYFIIPRSKLGAIVMFAELRCFVLTKTDAAYQFDL